jgi:hypothetical protein
MYTFFFSFEDVEINAFKMCLEWDM